MYKSECRGRRGNEQEQVKCRVLILKKRSVPREPQGFIPDLPRRQDMTLAMHARCRKEKLLPEN